jgi:hypothetical protein
MTHLQQLELHYRAYHLALRAAECAELSRTHRDILDAMRVRAAQAESRVLQQMPALDVGALYTKWADELDNLGWLRAI